MAAPGVSAVEILRAIRIAKHIVESFRDGYDSASARIKELVSTCLFLRNVLYVFLDVIESTGFAFPFSTHLDFERKLDECDQFIESRYSTLHNQDQVIVRTRWSFRRVIQTGRFVFDDTKVARLKDDLSLEIQKLLALILVSALYETLFRFVLLRLNNHLS